MREPTFSKTSVSRRTVRLVTAALLLALCLLLPSLVGQLPHVGSMLLPMHLPVLLCGFLCGPKYGMLVGVIAPLLRFGLFGAPPPIPSGVCMCVELAAYGFFSGVLYAMLYQRKAGIWLALGGAMLLGRIAWLAACLIVYPLLAGRIFTFSMFLAGAFLNAWPGILLQLLLVPAIVRARKRFQPI